MSNLLDSEGSLKGEEAPWRREKSPRGERKTCDRELKGMERGEKEELLRREERKIKRKEEVGMGTVWGSAHRKLLRGNIRGEWGVLPKSSYQDSC